MLSGQWGPGLSFGWGDHDLCFSPVLQDLQQLFPELCQSIPGTQ